jgi:hypothetical protein
MGNPEVIVLTGLANFRVVERPPFDFKPSSISGIQTWVN